MPPSPRSCKWEHNHVFFSHSKQEKIQSQKLNLKKKRKYKKLHVCEMQSEWKRELKIYVCDLYYWFEVLSQWTKRKVRIICQHAKKDFTKSLAFHYCYNHDCLFMNILFSHLWCPFNFYIPSPIERVESLLLVLSRWSCRHQRRRKFVFMGLRGIVWFRQGWSCS